MSFKHVAVHCCRVSWFKPVKAHHAIAGTGENIVFEHTYIHYIYVYVGSRTIIFPVIAGGKLVTVMTSDNSTLYRECDVTTLKPF